MTPQCNPFRVRKIQPGALPYLFDGKESDARLNELAGQISTRRRSLIVGPHGSGKSTLLNALQPNLERHFGQVKFVRLRSDGSLRAKWIQVAAMIHTPSEFLVGHSKTGARTNPPMNLLVVDGIEQLSKVSRARLFLRTLLPTRMAVLATSHQAMVGWPSALRTRAEPNTILELSDRLIADLPANIQVEVRKKLDQEDVAKVADVREFWFRMYDVVAEVPQLFPPESA